MFILPKLIMNMNKIFSLTLLALLLFPLKGGAQELSQEVRDAINKYLDTEKTMNTVVLNEVGTYTVEVVAGGSKRVHNFFSQIQAEESAPSANDHNISIIGQASKKGLDAEFDPAIIIFILIILTFAADWMVYMYEKRQLR
jgi:hypothetical protein